MSNRSFTLLELLLAIAIVGFLIFIALFQASRSEEKMKIFYRLQCGTNMNTLGVILREYAAGHEGQYPTPNKWCDTLLKQKDVPIGLFFCKGSGENRDDKKISFYAINPKAKSDSPNDVVLLFETDKGWNQCGGFEILSIKNHDPKGCNVLLNGGSVKFIKANEIKSLRWD